MAARVPGWLQARRSEVNGCGYFSGIPGPAVSGAGRSADRRREAATLCPPLARQCAAKANAYRQSMKHKLRGLASHRGAIAWPEAKTKRPPEGGLFFPVSPCPPRGPGQAGFHHQEQRCKLSTCRNGGAPGRIRTSDPQVRSLVLYPTELRAQKRNYAGSTMASSIAACCMRMSSQVAETEGFEPSMELLTPYSLSRGAPSASRASLREAVQASAKDTGCAGIRQRVLTFRAFRRRPCRRLAGCAGRSLRDARPRPWAR